MSTSDSSVAAAGVPNGLALSKPVATRMAAVPPFIATQRRIRPDSRGRFARARILLSTAPRFWRDFNMAFLIRALTLYLPDWRAAINRAGHASKGAKTLSRASGSSRA